MKIKELKKYLKENHWVESKKCFYTRNISEAIKKDIIKYTEFFKDGSIGDRINLIFQEVSEVPLCKNPACYNKVSYFRGSFNMFCSDKCYSAYKKLHINDKLNLITDKTDMILDDLIFFLKEDAVKLDKNNLERILIGKLQNYGAKKENEKILYNIYNHTSFLKNESDTFERVYCLTKNIRSTPICNHCNKNAVEFNGRRYNKYCSKDCKYLGSLETTKKNNMKKYGEEYTFQVGSIKDKIKESTIKKYGVDNVSKLDSIKEKKKETSLNNYGETHFFKTDIYKDNITELSKIRTKEEKETTLLKSKKTKKEKYNDENYNNRDQAKETYIKIYGFDNPNKSDIVKKKKKETNLNRRGVEYSLQDPEVIEKRRVTCLDKYGEDNYSKTAQFKESLIDNQEVRVFKSNKTKRENNTFNSSKAEDDLFYFLDKFFDIKQQYFSSDYPFNCDYYIEKYDLYIELQGHPHHGKESFDIENKDHLEILNILKYRAEFSKEEKTKKYYSNWINTWTIRDPKKLEKANKSNIKLLRIYNYKNNIFDKYSVLHKIYSKLEFLKICSSYDSSLFTEELLNIRNKEYSYNTNATTNQNILFFNPHFYEKEQEIYKTNPVLRRKLIQNRIKYLNKKEEELTDLDLIKGFKKSKIHYGYSFFSPFWIKRFIKEYNIKSIYDPCGGWGHRLLGAYNIKYIYNDISKKSYLGCKAIRDNYKLVDKYFYNNKSEEFAPDESYECVFTCPPYFNLEKYEGMNQSTSSYKSYKDWLNNWWDKTIKCSIKNKNIKYFCYVMSEKYAKDMNKIVESNNFVLEKSIQVAPRRSGYGSNSFENIYIFTPIK